MADRTYETPRDPERASGIDPIFERLLQTEEQADERRRRFAVMAGACAFTCLVVFALSVMVVRESGGTMVNLARFALMISGATGIASLLASSAAALSMLLRPRAPSLRAIDRRLAALESLLARTE